MSARATGWALRVSVAIVGIACAAGLYRIAMTIGLRVPFDPNEGWNAYHALAAMTMGSPYPPAGSFLTNNYPPLSFYIVGFLGRALGDQIVAGRIVSLAAFLAVAGGIAAALRMMACSMAEATFGALMFAACLLLNSDYVGMDDPQMLGHAVAMVGLLLILMEPRTLSRLAGAAFLFALAFFIKHNLIVLPIAVTAWLAIFERRSAIRLAVAGVILFLAGLALFRLGFGFGLLDRLQSARTYSLNDFFVNASSWFFWGLLPLIVAAVLFIVRHGDKFVVLCATYALVGTLIGLSYLGGAGIDMNAMFDADIALALVAGLALNHFRERLVLFAGTLAAFLLPLAAGLYLAATNDWLDNDYWVHPMRDEAALAALDIDFLRAHEGPALCETLAYCYWAGKPAAVDVFNAGQQFATKRRSDEPLLRLIDSRKFAAMQFDTFSPFALGNRINRAVHKDYRIDHANDDGIFLIPR